MVKEKNKIQMKILHWIWLILKLLLAQYLKYSTKIFSFSQVIAEERRIEGIKCSKMKYNCPGVGVSGVGWKEGKE